MKILQKKRICIKYFWKKNTFKGINDKNFNVRSFQERAAINAPIQGSAADIIRLAMIKIDELKLIKIKNLTLICFFKFMTN